MRERLRTVASERRKAYDDGAGGMQQACDLTFELSGVIRRKSSADIDDRGRQGRARGRGRSRIPLRRDFGRIALRRDDEFECHALV